MIRINNLSKSYGQKIIFNNMSMNIEENKINFLMGKNGSGKTTLLKCMLDLEHFSGDIKYNDSPLEKIRDEVYVIYDDSPFYINLSGYKNIKLLLNKTFTKEEIEEESQKFLDHAILKKKVKTYSYGQRKKLSLIIVSLLRPKYLFLDEISNGLDYSSMMELKEIVKEWSDSMTIVATGHQFEFYSSIVDELFVLKGDSAVHIKSYKAKGAELGDIYKEHL